MSEVWGHGHAAVQWRGTYSKAIAALYWIVGSTSRVKILSRDFNAELVFSPWGGGGGGGGGEKGVRSVDIDPSLCSYDVGVGN